MLVYILFVCGSGIDVLLNRKVVIRPVHYENYVIAEYLGDFGNNVFYGTNLDYTQNGYNKIAYIEKINEQYNIKIGNYYLCHDQTVACSLTDEMCLNEKYKIMDCTKCNSRKVSICKDKKDLWAIEKTSLGYTIRQDDLCLSLGTKLYMTKCNKLKDQIFGFEDYETQSCLGGYERRVETKRDLIDKLKTNEMKKKTKKPDDMKESELPDKIKELTDDNVNQRLEKILPGIKDKPKMRRLWGSLWKNDFSGYSFNNPFSLKAFCTKWW